LARVPPRIEHAARTHRQTCTRHHATCNATAAACGIGAGCRAAESLGRDPQRSRRNQSFAAARYRIHDAASGTLRAFDRGFCANNGFFVKTRGDSEQDAQMYRWDRPHEGGADDFTLATKQEVLRSSLT
jgi:hypothetical protein